MVELPSLPDAPAPGGRGDSRAESINDSGQVVGVSGGQAIGTTVVFGHAFLWSQADGIVDLGALPGDLESAAKAINDHGQVVGSSGSALPGPGPHFRAFSWTPAGGMVDLGTLPGDTWSSALAINNQGQIVGTSGDGNGSRAFLWTPAGGMVELGALPGATTSAARGINDSGQVVGTSGSDAVLWFGDTTGPVARLRPVTGQKIATLLRSGLRVKLTLSEPAANDIAVSLGSSNLRIAHASLDSAGAGTATVTLKLDRTAHTRKARARLGKATKVTLNVRTTARDRSGNSAVTTTKLVLKR
jgi:probable HAF family extracellular repeat protein